jgi:DNA-directed RNA polymerase specialized sigma subunit
VNGETHDGLGLSTREIARRLGISNVRVQQLERRALQKMEKLARARGIKLEDVFKMEVP